MPDHTDPRPAIFKETDLSFSRFLAHIDALTPEQWRTTTDPAGWTVKDHVIHCALWAGSLAAVIDKQPRWEAMEIPYEIWETITGNYDQINQFIWQSHRHISPEGARRSFVEAYLSLKKRVLKMSLLELKRPYSHFQDLAETETHPIYTSVRGNTGDHFDEHLGYIRKILRNSKE